MPELDDYTSPCPYCGTTCNCDLVDVGVGLVQCGPYHCERCGATEIGAYDKPGATACEQIFGWYGPGRPPGSSANVIGGKVVSHQVMERTYREEFQGNPLWQDKAYVEDWYEKVRK
jgi:hypothetical protein